MEIDVVVVFFIVCALFKIDLIVWKCVCNVGFCKISMRFKIDLIVWKLVYK